MHFLFAWRYFKAKKSAHAINIIAWVTVGVIAFATCCQVLVLSVFNGFEGLVKSLYADFYTDLKITPVQGKTFTVDLSQRERLKQLDFIDNISMVVEENALLQHDDVQKKVKLKGVDGNHIFVSGIAQKISNGQYNTGTTDTPFLVAGAGIQNDMYINTSDAQPLTILTVTLPKKSNHKTDLSQSLSEGNLTARGTFSIQQEFDNSYALTNIGFIKKQMGYDENEFSAIEIKTKNKVPANAGQVIDESIFGSKTKTLTRYQQNTTLYHTMLMEKWAIYAVLTLILVIAAFNMVSALTMLVLEKQKDISILQTMGARNSLIRKIFLSEGFLLGIIGSLSGIILAVIICTIQLKTHFISLQGNSFLIDYFPVKMLPRDFLLVLLTTLAITLLASWFPASKAANQYFSLK
jgi:lipoprotein-releasing system permease protein